MKTTKFLVLFLLFLNAYESNVFGQQLRIATSYPDVGNHSQSNIADLSITRVSIWEDRTYVYFEYKTSPNLRDGWISLSSKTTLTAKNTNISLKIEEWGFEGQELNELKLDTQYSVNANKIYVFYMIFPVIPEGIEYISIRENIDVPNEFYWEDIHISYSSNNRKVRSGGIPIKREINEKEDHEEIDEVRPKFLGDDENTFNEWVKDHIKYPEIAKENGIQGKVMLTFVIDETGRVTDVTVLRNREEKFLIEIDGREYSVTVLKEAEKELAEEAVRVVSSSPRWTPGYQRNKPVRVRYNFPVVFQLR